MGSTVGQFCIAVADLERSVHFYTEILGLAEQSRTDIPHVNEVVVAGAEGGGRAEGGRVRYCEREGPSRRLTRARRAPRAAPRWRHAAPLRRSLAALRAPSAAPSTATSGVRSRRRLRDVPGALHAVSGGAGRGIHVLIQYFETLAQQALAPRFHIAFAASSCALAALRPSRWRAGRARRAERSWAASAPRTARHPSLAGEKPPRRLSGCRRA